MNFFQSAKTSVQVSVVPKLTMSLYAVKHHLQSMSKNTEIPSRKKARFDLCSFPLVRFSSSCTSTFGFVREVHRFVFCNSFS